MSDIDKTLADRGNRYGEFDEHARITQGIKDRMRDSKNWLMLPDDMKEALEMAAHKIGRILNGDPDYIDSWTDIIGYTRLVEKRLVAEQQNDNVFAFPTAAHDTAAAKTEECDCPVCLFRRELRSRA